MSLYLQWLQSLVTREQTCLPCLTESFDFAQCGSFSVTYFLCNGLHNQAIWLSLKEHLQWFSMKASFVQIGIVLKHLWLFLVVWSISWSECLSRRSPENLSCPFVPASTAVFILLPKHWLRAWGVCIALFLSATILHWWRRGSSRSLMFSVSFSATGTCFLHLSHEWDVAQAMVKQHFMAHVYVLHFLNQLWPFGWH